MTRSGILVFLLIVFFIFGILSSQKALDQFRTPEAELEKNIYLPDGKVLKIVSLGFSSLISDFLWMKAVLYFGRNTFDEDNPFVELLEKKRNEQLALQSTKNQTISHSISAQGETQQLDNSENFTLVNDPKLKILRKFESKGMAPYIYPLLKRVVELNPYFIYPYEFGGLIVLHDSGEIDKAYSLLEYGWKHNPNRWELAYYLGFVDLLYKGNTDKALKRLSQALLLPDHPPFIQQVYDSILHRGNYKNSVIDYLKGLYYSTENEESKEQILKMIEDIANSQQKS